MTAIVVACSSCHARFKAPLQTVRRREQCPSCGNMIIVMSLEDFRNRKQAMSQAPSRCVLCGQVLPVDSDECPTCTGAATNAHIPPTGSSYAPPQRTSRRPFWKKLASACDLKSAALLIATSAFIIASSLGLWFLYDKYIDLPAYGIIELRRLYVVAPYEGISRTTIEPATAFKQGKRGFSLGGVQTLYLTRDDAAGNYAIVRAELNPKFVSHLVIEDIEVRSGEVDQRPICFLNPVAGPLEIHCGSAISSPRNIDRIVPNLITLGSGSRALIRYKTEERQVMGELVSSNTSATYNSEEQPFFDNGTVSMEGSLSYRPARTNATSANPFARPSVSTPSVSGNLAITASPALSCSFFGDRFNFDWSPPVRGYLSSVDWSASDIKQVPRMVNLYVLVELKEPDEPLSIQIDDGKGFQVIHREQHYNTRTDG